MGRTQMCQWFPRSGGGIHRKVTRVWTDTFAGHQAILLFLEGHPGQPSLPQLLLRQRDAWKPDTTGTRAEGLEDGVRIDYDQEDAHS